MYKWSKFHDLDLKQRKQKAKVFRGHGEICMQNDTNSLNFNDKASKTRKQVTSSGQMFFYRRLQRASWSAGRNNFVYFWYSFMQCNIENTQLLKRRYQLRLISIFSYGSIIIQPTKMVLASFEENHLRNISVKFFNQNPSSGQKAI